MDPAPSFTAKNKTVRGRICTKFSLTNYWSSTEYSANNAWNLNFNTGNLNNNNKATNRLRVRPCAAFRTADIAIFLFTNHQPLIHEWLHLLN